MPLPLSGGLAAPRTRHHHGWRNCWPTARPRPERTTGKPGRPSQSWRTAPAWRGPAGARDAAPIRSLVPRTRLARERTSVVRATSGAGARRRRTAGGAGRSCRRACNRCLIRAFSAYADIRWRMNGSQAKVVETLFSYGPGVGDRTCRRRWRSGLLRTTRWRGQGPAPVSRRNHHTPRTPVNHPVEPYGYHLSMSATLVARTSIGRSLPLAAGWILNSS